MTANQPRAAIYARISRDAEGEEFGVKRQITLCKALAADRGLTVDEAHIYSDNDVGASERTGAKKRESYERLLKAARAGEFSVILSYSITRLTRRVREFETLIKLHESTGITFGMVDSKSDLDLSTPQGLFMARIMANVSTFESDVISQRQKAAFLDNAMAGKPKIQRQRPFGWEEDGITLREDEATLVREAIEQIKAGESIASIRHRWEAAGVRTAAGGSKWEHGVLKRVLVGWRAAGVRTYRREVLYKDDGQPVMGIWEPIISLEDRELALAMLNRRTRKKKRQGKWLLSGLVRCGACGGSMYGQITGTPTYACKPGNGHLAITAEKLEEHVQHEVASRIVRKMTHGERKPDAPKDWPHAERLATVIAKSAELWDAYNADILTMNEVRPASNKLEAERLSLVADRESFYEAQVQPVLPMRTSDLLDWAQDLLVEPVRPLPRSFDNEDEDEDDYGGAWGGKSAHPDPAPAPTDPDDAIKRLVLRQEIEEIIIKRGNRGRAGWGDAAFKARINILWTDELDTSEL